MKYCIVIIALLGFISLNAQVVLPVYQATHVRQFEDCGTVTDADGNVYPSIVIGTQCFMRKNLETTKYNDGTLIPNVTDETTWAGLTTPAYGWYENNYETYGSIYGALYNWYAVNTGKLCPTGWHIPSQTEFSELVEYLGGSSVAGGALKEIGTTHWNDPNVGATNSSGYTALGGGQISYDGSSSAFGIQAVFWSSTDGDSTFPDPPSAYFLGIPLEDIFIVLFPLYKTEGYSVRCVKN